MLRPGSASAWSGRPFAPLRSHQSLKQSATILGLVVAGLIIMWVFRVLPEIIRFRRRLTATVSALAVWSKMFTLLNEGQAVEYPILGTQSWLEGLFNWGR
jgi:hypothetical protein